MKKDEYRHDQGRQFGHFGHEGWKFFHEDSDMHTRLLCASILQYRPLPYLTICDVGGGNGLAAKNVVRTLSSRYPHMKADILDFDDSKFEYGNPCISFIKHDIRVPFPKKYDASLCRSALHYNTPSDQALILQNLANGTKGPIALIQPCPKEKEMEHIQALYKLIADLKNIHPRYFLSAGQLEDLINETGLHIITAETINETKFTLEGYYRTRYALSQDESDKVDSFLGKEGYATFRIQSYLLKRIEKMP